MAFYVLGTIFPRLTLLGFYMFGNIPNNDTPFALDVLAAISMPRLLIAYYGWSSGFLHPLWAVLLVLLQIVESTRSVKGGTNSTSSSTNSSSTTYRRRLY
jgi:hypothetical protein